MYLLSWIILGLAAGWSIGKLFEGNDYGPLMDLTIGIGGAIGGGFLMRSAGFSGYRGPIYTTLAAIIGAVLLTLLVGFVNGRRLYARQL
jgi:uncharacterized membrane protein YeaQ/YmgE (transglycosylase-associated protein family)